MLLGITIYVTKRLPHFSHVYNVQLFDSSFTLWFNCEAYFKLTEQGLKAEF